MAICHADQRGQGRACKDGRWASKVLPCETLGRVDHHLGGDVPSVCEIPYVTFVTCEVSVPCSRAEQS